MSCRYIDYGFFSITDLYCSEEAKPIQMLQWDKMYPITRVLRLRHSLPEERNHFILLWEAPSRQGRYILPLHDYCCENEIIQINN